MAAIEKIIENYKGVSIAGNELLANIVLNRIFKKLFENDEKLSERVQAVSNGVYRILPWSEEKSYKMHDLVWYVDCYLPPGKEKAYNNDYEKTLVIKNKNKLSDNDIKNLQDKYFTVTLYLLRSLKNGNTNRPVRTIVDMIPFFDASGWKNENPMGSIYTDYFDEFTADNIRKQLDNMHQATAVHPFGELRNFEEIKEKVLLKNMSNINPDRNVMFFPNETFAVNETKSILNGSCRKWDCGLLEYDLTFKLGDSEYGYSAYNPDGTLKISEEIDANYMNLAKSLFAAGKMMEYDNRKYYLNDSDSDIFIIPDGVTMNAGGVTQHNIDTRINSFYGRLEFQEPFIDTNYSIFPVNNPVVQDALGNIVKNENTMVFINKARSSVTAMLVIPNINQSDYKILGDNTFRCRITGRWK